ncbi:hypothetical protein G7Y79_00033g068240 [Physcia stellaris]|nr:hypothetical protein G7Y79_00033g068240 [Physcia stellaris]
MENFIEGIGERYLQRKANAVPQQIENFAKKHFTDAPHGKSPQTPKGSVHDKDQEIERLRRELAATKLRSNNSETASVRHYHEEPHRRHSPHESRRAPSEVSATPSIRELRDTHRHHSPHESRKAPSEVSRAPSVQKPRESHHHHSPHSSNLSQSDINRLALQHADTSSLPLKAENLELLTRQQHLLEREHRHGGSAALLHASRDQPERRETLSYSGHDVKGVQITKTFRPSRVDGGDWCVVEVEEEEEERPSRIRVVERDVKRKETETGRYEKHRDGKQKEGGAVEIERNGDRRLYRIT